LFHITILKFHIIGMCAFDHCTTPQTLKSDWKLIPLSPAPYRFSYSTCFLQKPNIGKTWHQPEEYTKIKWWNYELLQTSGRQRLNIAVSLEKFKYLRYICDFILALLEPMVYRLESMELWWDKIYVNFRIKIVPNVYVYVCIFMHEMK
jgi:hypothetical protein